MLNILIISLFSITFCLQVASSLGPYGSVIESSENVESKLMENLKKFSKFSRKKRTASSSSTHIAFQSNYKTQGSMTKVADLDVYETKDKSGKKLLIAVYDIFGYHNNTFRTADKLAEFSGFKVVMPDYFRKHEFPNTEELNVDEIYKFVQAHGDWKKVKSDTLKVIDHYKTKEGIQTFGMYGHCWGGNMAVMAGGQLSDIQVVGAFHPFGLPKEDVEKVKVPTFLMPSMSDADLTEHFKILQKKFGPRRCGYRRFTDMVHGFTSARGTDRDKLTVKRIDEAVTLMSKFVNEMLMPREMGWQGNRRISDRLVEK